MSTETLIAAILAGPSVEALPHQESLAAIGAPAIPAIVDGVRANKGPSRRRLAEVVGRIRDPEAVPLLLPLIEDSYTGLALATIQALSHLPDPRAGAPLLKAWAWNDGASLARALVVNNVPDLAAAFRTTLERWLGNTSDPSRAPELMSSAIVASLAVVAPELERAGDTLGFESLHAVARYAGSADTRERAVLSMWRAVGPGCVETLKATLRDPDPQVRQAAAFASYFLGVGALVPDLVQVGVADADETVAATARDAIARIGNMSLTQTAPSPERVTAWFDADGVHLDPDIAWRRGERLHPRTVAAMIAVEPRGPWDRALEFEILTGAGLPHRSSDDTPTDELGALAVAWALAHAADFVPGAIYREGRRITVV